MSYSDIPGYSGFLWLYDEAVAHFPSGKFVEVGVALGHSLAYLARGVIDSGKPIEVYGVDPWGGYARNGEQQEALGESPKGDFALFLEYMTKHAPEELERCNIIRETSVAACNLFPFEGVSMVLIDGAHDARSVRDDIEAWYPRIAPGGWLAGDDYDPRYPGVAKAVHEAFGASRVEVKGTTWRVKLWGG